VCYFSPKWAKTHLRASVVQKKFLGSLSLAIREEKGRGRGWRRGWEWGGEGRREEREREGTPQFQQQIYAPGKILYIDNDKCSYS
jgi:hypothetical protein